MPLPATQFENLLRVAPELILCAFGILIMIVDPFVPAPRKKAMGGVGVAGALLALGGVWISSRHPGLAYAGLLRVDGFSIFLHYVVTGVAVLAMLGAFAYLDEEKIQKGEYYALILFATAGMGILIGANELVTAFLGLEISSISSYILAGFRRDAPKCNEASLKYFLLGSFATAFFLYGIAMTYGATGTTNLDAIASSLERTPSSSLLILGIGMMFVGLGFKVVAVPFQIYAPDVYEGAPAPVTALISTGPKAAAFAVMLRIFYTAFGSEAHIWFWAIWISAALTMTVGNLAALVQTNVKRMLAYSSIAHAGYILVAFAASTTLGIAAILFYLAAYTIVKLGAFVVVAHVGGAGERRLDISDYAGLSARQPVLALCFSVFLFSLLGLPVTGGFLGKFYAFRAALNYSAILQMTGDAFHGKWMVWLVVIAAINSVIGAYYYLRVVVAMYFWEPKEDWKPARMTPAVALVLIVAVLGTIYLGLAPNRVMGHALQSASALPSQLTNHAP
ncbi:MAG: NADH-quinone oxidoreductase subunit N [Candidatus Acidiferrales bacterium]